MTARPGTVVTFYSFKGGTGRTMAVANIGWLLAARGYRVAVVDWDLEAPGLHRYFHPLLDDPELVSTWGVLDLLRDYVAAALALDSPVQRAAGRGPGGLGGRDRVAAWVRDYLDDRFGDYGAAVRFDFGSGTGSGHGTGPGSGSLDLLPAGLQDDTYPTAVNTFDWFSFQDALAGGLLLDALRERLRADYDFTLIDSRTGWNDSSGACLVVLPDTVVDCFSLNTQSIAGAEQAARAVRERSVGRRIQVLPAALRVEDAEQRKVEAGRDLARALFAPHLASMSAEETDRYWADMEVPYKPFYAYEEIPAVVGDRPLLENSLLAAYARMADRIAGSRAPGGPPQLPERQRRELLARYERLPVSQPSAALISYAAPDRLWAEWIRRQLHLLGFRPRLAPAGRALPPPEAAVEGGPAPAAPLVLTLLSAAHPGPDGPDGADGPDRPDRRDRPRAAVPERRAVVRIGDVPVPRALEGAPLVDMVGLAGPEEARDALVAGVGRPVRPERGQRSEEPAGWSRTARYPGSVPAVWRVPTRNPGFTGREELLDRIRTALAGGSEPGGAAPCVLCGLGGVGKTQAALEYAHRFRADYDAVWWVSAEDTGLLAHHLAGLGGDLGLPADGDVGALAGAVREALRRGEPYRRWLLILDNAEQPGLIAPYLPAGGGHVLITSRDRADWDAAARIDVDVFSREESTGMLRRENPELSEYDAARIAKELGDLPLAVRHAAAWLRNTGESADTYLDKLDVQVGGMAVSDPEGSEDRSMAAAWLLTWNRIGEEMPAAGELLLLLAFLGPDPVPAWLARSDRMRQRLLRYDPQLGEPDMVGKVFREISKYEGVRMDGLGGGITMHRLVQAVLRRQVEPERWPEFRAAVHGVLAAANPRNPDQPGTWVRYSALLPHLWPTRAERSADPEVRQWIADTVRYLWRRGDHRAVRDAAERILAEWQPRFGPDDRLVLMIRNQLANALRAGGELEEAHRIDADVLRRCRDTLGEHHLDTLTAAGSLAASLRAAGRYGEARHFDRSAFDTSREVFGEDHPRTLMLASNLALSRFLLGEYYSARDLDRETRDRMVAVFGADHPSTLLSARNYARDLHETGEAEAAVRLLQTTLRAFRSGLGESHDDTLRTAKVLATALRKTGRYESSEALSRETLAQYRAVRGEHHPETLACACNLACDLAALGHPREARALARETAAACAGTTGRDHPLTRGCITNLAVYQRLCGEPEAAARLTAELLPGYRAELGGNHPITLACAVDHAANLAESGAGEEAVALGREALDGYLATLGEGHPAAVVCAWNLALDLEAAGRTDEARELRHATEGSALRAFGVGHPLVSEVMSSGRRLHADIEPPLI
ncbi:FxSxx-COOH system tetratricopeptide repeat protein [Phaeacidiphilus oryzae]|uniref:FxSxx-COOH system tetratricopeptide repeat protein n=1 Tax=Phaeacidiphilus oryzae TaxID=348818 RepID=UPI0005662841|nr:FxSxx-COOH system tetratricopeptide repeat protein [Phaeacidiphilus oryzae]